MVGVVVVVAFSSLVRFWENVQPFIPHLSPFFFFSFIKVKISLSTLIPLLRLSELRQLWPNVP